jgi:hypothetical protein
MMFVNLGNGVEKSKTGSVAFSLRKANREEV